MTEKSARILIVEDRAPDRLYLSSLLSHSGYDVVEASNGLEGLAAAAEHPPDLVISDVLMPAMDGYEFVRRLRRTPAGADVPIVFYTATFREREARDLALERGVIEVMIKPTEPQVVLARVGTLLARGRATLDLVADEPFERHHARVTSDRLLEAVRDLDASERRMTSLVQLGQQFLEERDPARLLERVCQSVRDITLARYAVVAVFSDDETRLAHVVTSGYDRRTAEFVGHSTAVPAVARTLTLDRQAVRGGDPDGGPEALGLPPWHAPIHSYMFVPIRSSGQRYGFLAVLEKVGAPAFSEADEIVAVTLGLQAGVAYENARLIRQLKTQAAALRQSEATTEFALTTARVGIYDRDLTTNEIRKSRALAHLLRVPDDASLADVYEALHPDDRTAVQAAIERAIRDRTEFALDARAIDGTGRVSHLQFRGQVLLDDRGAPARLLSVMIDMSERRLLEDQLRQAQKMEAVGQLAGGVAHDFNNLLTAILGYSRFLLPTDLDEQQRADVDEIIKAGERAAVLTRQLLAFSRRQVQQLSVFDLNFLIGDLVQMLRRLVGEHVSLVTRLADTAMLLHADRGHIEQVLMNLVLNGCDAMPTGGTITLSTEAAVLEDIDWVRLVVSDTGTGMTEETKSRLFEPFFTTKGVGRGTGLGLATVFGIVTQSGGSVSVDSTLGQGTTFTLHLPMAAGRSVSNEPDTQAVASGSERILLVEDELVVRMLTRSILERAGYRVVAAANGAEARTLFGDNAFDLLVADVLMPGGTGPELFRHLSASRPALRVVYISGYAQDTILDIRHLGPNAGFVAKPFTAESLTCKVREVLDR